MLTTDVGGEPAAAPRTAARRSAGAEEQRSRTSGKSVSAFRTISEVSDDLDVPQHVLRFWESKFSQLRPLKRGGGRRYYRPEDIALLRRIHELLYREGYTIKGVQRVLRAPRRSEQAGVGAESAVAPDGDLLTEAPLDDAPPDSAAAPDAEPAVEARPNAALLRDLLVDLRELRAMLD